MALTLPGALIDDLLDLTRIARDKQSLEKKPLPGHDILQEALANMQVDAAQKQMVFKTALAAFNDVIQGDAVRLGRFFPISSGTW